ncbi:MAG: hypothetical protein IPM91_19410 [Bacteroidetes bacterium]|nr:hypothetical protein [Bacteroidota bacterium]
MVKRINESGMIIGDVLRSACIDIEKEILTFQTDIVTCPSSYLFRTSSLNEAGLHFDERLSSSADRYFLLEASKLLKGVLIKEEGVSLFYRYRANSMSNKLNRELIEDNELYYHLVIEKIKPEGLIRSIFLSKSKYVLAGAFLELEN